MNVKIIMKKILLMAVAVILFAACSSEKKNSEVYEIVIENSVDTIPYRIVKGYALKQGVDKLLTPKLASSKAFKQYFEAKGAEQTEIDFNSEYVIAAIKPEAKGERLVLDAIDEASGNRVLMTFYVEKSDEESNSLLLVVPDSIEGHVDVKEII